MLPAYNEEPHIRAGRRGFLRCRASSTRSSSSTTTRGTARPKKRPRTRARVVRETAQGYGHALRRGLREATGDIVIMAEPDGTFVGRDVLKLLAYADDFDMVCGTRTTRELIWEQANMGWFLRVGNWAVAKMIQVLYDGPSLTDCGCTLRLMHRPRSSGFSIELTVGGSHFLPEMVILGSEARPAHHRGAGQLPRACRRIEDHRQSQGTLRTGSA